MFSCLMIFTYGLTVFCLVRLATLVLVVHDESIIDTDGDQYAKCMSDENDDGWVWGSILLGYWGGVAATPCLLYAYSRWQQGRVTQSNRKSSQLSAYKSRSTLGSLFRPSRPNWDFINSDTMPPEQQFEVFGGSE